MDPINAFCEQVLLGERLEDKLLDPGDSLSLAVTRPYTKAIPESPGRPKVLTMGRDHRQKQTFPLSSHLSQPTARGRALHFFANHELLALELMALALLRFWQAPQGFRLGLYHTLREEQAHMRLYMQRMEELGVGFGELPVNDFFWHCMHGMATPLDYVRGMSLTFEQANLDFSLYYRDLFTEVGDQDSAGLMQKVYDDEIGHVQHGLKWFDHYRDPSKTRFEAYAEGLKLPLNPRRAKGKGFYVEARRKVGLDEDFIKQLQMYRQGRAQGRRLLRFNGLCEWQMSHEKTDRPPERLVEYTRDLAPLMLLLGRDQDAMALQDLPPGSQQTSGYMLVLKELGLPLPQLVQKTSSDWPTHAWANDHEIYRTWSDKTRLVALRQQLTPEAAFLGRVVEAQSGLAELKEAVCEVFAAGFTSCVLKPAYGTAGRGLVRLDRQRGWSLETKAVQRAFGRCGRIIVEPWLPRVLDFSLVLEVQEKRWQLQLMRSEVDHHGRYRGHFLGRVKEGLSGELDGLLSRHRKGGSFMEQLQQCAEAVALFLQQQGFRGAAGVDAYLAKDPRQADSWLLQPLGELNLRLTMGHVAAQCRKLVAQGSTGYFRLLDPKQIAEQLLTQPQAPRPREPGSRRVRSGCVWLTDLSLARQVAALLEVKPPLR